MDTNLHPKDRIAGNVAFRLDWNPSRSDSLHFSTDFDQGHSDVALAGFYSLEYPTMPVIGSASPSRDAATLHWMRTWENRSQTEVQASYERISCVDNAQALRNTIAEIQVNHHVHLSSRHDLVAGAGYRFDDSITTFAMHLLDAFFQDEYGAVEDKLNVVAGLQVDQNSWSGFEVQPTFRVLWVRAT